MKRKDCNSYTPGLVIFNYITSRVVHQNLIVSVKRKVVISKSMGEKLRGICGSEVT